MKTAYVADLYAMGFSLGPDPESTCEHCPHPWGHHTLITESPLDGGTYLCGADEDDSKCECHGTWGVPLTPRLEEMRKAVGL